MAFFTANFIFFPVFTDSFLEKKKNKLCKSKKKKKKKKNSTDFEGNVLQNFGW